MELRSAIAELLTEYEGVVLQLELEELSCQQVADVLDRPFQHCDVSSRLAHARLRITPKKSRPLSENVSGRSAR
jgi:DNA-directed RNA polymerase specialized sigma24 family protein